VDTQRHTLRDTQRYQVPLPAVAQPWADGNLDYPWLIGDNAAHRVGAEVPALRQLTDGVVLIVGDAGSFKLHRRPPVRGWSCWRRLFLAFQTPRVPSLRPSGGRQTDENEFSDRNSESDVAPLKSASDPHEQRVVAGVAFSEGRYREERAEEAPQEPTPLAIKPKSKRRVTL